MPRRRPEQEHLNRYWNALNRGAPPEELARLAEPLDPTLIAAIDRAHALHRRRRPDPAFANRLERDLMHAFATAPAGSVPLRPRRSGPLNGRFSPRSQARPLFGGSESRRRWAFAQLATALLLVVTLLAVYFAFFNGNQPAHQPVTPLPTTPVIVPTPATSGWTNFKGNAGRTGVADAGPTGQPVQLWHIRAGGACEQPPDAVAGVVYAPCNDGVLYALETTSGQERWRFTGSSLLGATTVSGGLVYQVDGDILRTLDAATGQERWTAPAPGGSAPVVDGGLLVIGTGDGYLLGLDAATGAERWRYQVATDSAVHNPALSGGIAYVGSDAPNFVAVDAATGTLLWQGDVGTDSRTGTATVTEGIAYIGGSGDGGTGHLSAFDARTGALLWRRAEPLQSPAVLDGVGYSGSEAGIVYAFDTATGNERWRTQFQGGPVRPLAVTKDVVYAPCDCPVGVVALDPATGNQIWNFPVDSGIHGSIAVTGGVAYETTATGGIYAIGGIDQGAIPVASPETPSLAPATPKATPATTASPSASANPLALVWTTQGGADGLVNPGSMAIDPSGRIWVADNAHSRFQVFAADGAFLRTVGDGTFRFGINGSNSGTAAFAADGTTYLLDPTAQTVYKYDVNGQFVTKWGGPDSGPSRLQRPENLAVDAAGTVWVGDDGLRAIMHFDANGQVLGTIANSADLRLDAVGGMAIDDAGDLYVANGANEIVELRPDGTIVQTFTMFSDAESNFNGGPVFFTVDREGRLFVTAVDFSTDPPRGRIHVFAPDGTLVSGWAWTGQFPTGIALDGAGNIYVADYFLNTVQKFRLLPPLGPEATPTA
jgi:outer membrane protein assembly factor BamB